MTKKKTNGSGVFNRAALLSLLSGRKTDNRVPLEIPEWGQTVYIRRITARQAQMVADAKDSSQDEKTALMLRTCLCNEAGEPLIETVEDAALLMDNETAHVVNGIVEKIVEVNKLGSSEETAKNLPPAQATASR